MTNNTNLPIYEKMAKENTSKIFGPLLFEDNITYQDNHLETKCIICEDSFNLKVSLPVFAAHLFDVHHIVIEEIQTIQNLHEYVLYWRQRFKCIPLEQVIPSLSIETSDQRYFIFSTLLKEDKEIRHKLKLEYALHMQEFERNDSSYVKPCLFCKLQFEGTRPGYLEHLSTQHNLQLGNPQNLVFIENLVEKIGQKLKDLRCIYCEKIFPDRNILKEHMRKKLHKRINPQNTEYDGFYIVNYLEQDKTWQTLQKEDDRYALPRGNSNSDDEYEDWYEKEDQITCLFCKIKETNINNLCLHMDGDHNFDFIQLTQELDFYQKIKLVNYIRKMVHDNKCIICEEAFSNFDMLDCHLKAASHYQLPELKVFNQPEFYFPTYENDPFLYLIDDVED